MKKEPDTRSTTIVRVGKITTSIILGVVSSSCGVPRFDVPQNPAGQPTVKTIVERLQCELRELVQDDKPDFVPSFHAPYLLNNDYTVDAALSLEVNETGGLMPSLDFIKPYITAGHSLTWGVNGTFSRSRTQDFTENMHFSMRDIYLSWKQGGDAYLCPSEVKTNLAGKLGLSDFVAMAAATTDVINKASDKGPFGGTIKFIITKNISGAGPTWTLTRFKGPGNLVTASQIYTDSITIAFAPGPNAGHGMYEKPGKAKPIPKTNIATPSTRQNSAQFLQQLLNNNINSKLDDIYNKIQQ
ncbi:hypothetical protein Rleg2_4934 (plasmid) [Rhizobium leguminosarum bv. trifolii WSM2304]|uniref:Lipoprotein n=1 Tax=Rhizobium leguminosarum bv. trifolii (strain WSM2304) TaxID=395492 RepID=A0ABF7QVK2_RHILW|nr:hypothetical protein [Rhizobium leguminosarum]ACI58166.1 hypothetical protein Rleg2_4934 [Rhizobium leguminosarum bv. trifolii WSM2304]